jgi:hypothetical protein
MPVPQRWLKMSWVFTLLLPTVRPQPCNKSFSAFTVPLYLALGTSGQTWHMEFQEFRPGIWVQTSSFIMTGCSLKHHAEQNKSDTKREILCDSSSSFFFFFFFEVLGLELRAFTLSHSTRPIFVRGFRDRVLQNYLPGLASNCDPPDLCLLSS